MASHDDDLPPELDDFSEVLDQVKPNDQDKGNKEYVGDYTKTRDEIEKEMQEGIQIQLQKQILAQQLEKLNLQEENIKKEEEERKKREKQQPKKKQSGGGLFGGLKGGFLNSGNTKKKSTQSQQKPQQKQPQKIEEVKFNKEQSEKNRLEIGEVQEAMKMKDFMQNSKDQWMTPDLLNKVAGNEKLQKLFTNQEYLAAINMMQKEPKKAMEMYGKNPEFMMLFQEFCKVMGTHMSKMGEDLKQEQQQQQQQQEQPLIQEVKKPPTKEDLQQIELQKRLQDPTVMEVMKDIKVQQFIAYMQKTGHVDFHQVMRTDPALGQKLQFLIQKGILNMEQK